MPRIGSQHDPATSSSRLDQLVAEMSARVEAGQPVDLSELAADCPEYREQLEMLLPTLEAVVDLEHSLGASDSQTSDPQAHHRPLQEGPLRGILGDFRIVREIGRGGMGVVYEAQQISLGRRLALKVLPLAATLSPQQLQRFKNEARAAASLKHPSIVGVYSVGVQRGVHFYAMELIEGRSLAEVIAEMRNAESRAELIAEKGPGSVPAALKDTSPIAGAALSTVRTTNRQDYYRQSARLIAAAAEAMEYAHGQGVIHRDIKPANLLIDEHAHVSITDFGLARLEADAGVTLTGDILGTLRYMSPEQAAGKPGQVDYRTDIHALGATLYELLTLEPPFNSDNRAELLRAVAETAPTPLCKVAPQIPTDLETIVAKAMEKDPADRYATAGELAADLKRFIEHRPIVASAPSLATRVRKWARRRPKLVAGAFAVLLLATLGLGISTAMIAAANHRASQRQIQAEENLRIASATIDKLLARVAADAQAHGQLRHADDLLRDAVASYDELLAKSDDPQLVLKAASAHHQLSEVLRLGTQYGEAHRAAEQGLQLLRRLPDDVADSDEALAERATLLGARGWAKLNLRDYSSAEWSLRECLMLRNRLSVASPRDLSRRKALLLAHNSLGVLLMESDRVAEGEAELRAATAIHQTLPQSEQDTPERLNHQAGLQANLASIAVKQGDYRRAIRAFREALALQRRVVAKLPEDPALREQLYQARWSLADALVWDGQYSAAADEIASFSEEFPERLQAQVEGVWLLVRCIQQSPPSSQGLTAPEDHNLGSSPEGAKQDSPGQSGRQAAPPWVTSPPGLRSPERAPHVLGVCVCQNATSTGCCALSGLWRHGAGTTQGGGLHSLALASALPWAVLLRPVGADLWVTTRSHGVARGGWSRTRDFQALAQKLLQRSHSSSFAPAAIQQELAWLLATCPVLELRDGERALSIATGLCERNPRHDENQHARAAAYLELHDYTEAVAAAEMARGDDGHGGDVYEFTLLALANAGLGDTDAANQWQKKALAAYDEQRYPLDQGLRALVQELNMNTRDGS